MLTSNKNSDLLTKILLSKESLSLRDLLNNYRVLHMFHKTTWSFLLLLLGLQPAAAAAQYNYSHVYGL